MSGTFKNFNTLHDILAYNINSTLPTWAQTAANLFNPYSYSFTGNQSARENVEAKPPVESPVKEKVEESKVTPITFEGVLAGTPASGHTYSWMDWSDAFNKAGEDGNFDDDELLKLATIITATNSKNYTKELKKNADRIRKAVLKGDSEFFRKIDENAQNDYYISNNTWHRRGGTGDHAWNDEEYEKAKAAGLSGLDKSALIKLYNTDLQSAWDAVDKMDFDPITGKVRYKFKDSYYDATHLTDDQSAKVRDAWLKTNLDKITYDPLNKTYTIEGYNDKDGNSVNIGTLDWFKNQGTLASDIRRNKYYTDVTNYTSKNLFSVDTIKLLLGNTGTDLIEKYDGESEEGLAAIRANIKDILMQALDESKYNNDEYDWDKAVYADALVKWTQDHMSDMPWMDRIEFKDGNDYYRTQKERREKSRNGTFARKGTILKYIKKHQEGNPITIWKPREGDEYFVPDEGVSFWTFLYNRGNNKTYKGSDGKEYYRYQVPTNPNYNMPAIYVPVKEGNAYLEEDNGVFGNTVVFKTTGPTSTDERLYKKWISWAEDNKEKYRVKPKETQEQPKEQSSQESKENLEASSKEKALQQGSELKKLAQPKTKKTHTYKSNYKSEFYKKQGGKMDRINYFKEGGHVMPTRKFQDGGQAADIQQQVVQLVQAAMQGDQQATDTINKIMQAAQQGDQQAAQIAQMIQQVAQELQGQAQAQATAAKYGAKLNYLRSLKSGCPEGTVAKYYKKGGALCKECVEKQAAYAKKGAGLTANSGTQENQQFIPEVEALPQPDITMLRKVVTPRIYANNYQVAKPVIVTSNKNGNKLKSKLNNKVEVDKCGKKMKKCEDGADLKRK